MVQKTNFKGKNYEKNLFKSNRFSLLVLRDNFNFLTKKIDSQKLRQDKQNMNKPM